MAGTATVVDVGRARPLRWWSAAGLAAAAERIRAAVEPWANSWGLALRTIEPSNATAAVPAGVQPSALAAGALLLWHEGGNVQDAICTALFGRLRMSVNRTESVADDVAVLAWGELRQAIESAASGVAPSAGIRGEASRWSGAVCIDLGLEGRAGLVQINVWLDTACAAAWCANTGRTPSQAVACVPLTPVQAVLSSRAVRLAVHLEPVELDLGSLQTLSVGDVLPLPHRLDNPLHVVVELDGTPSSTSWCRAHLAQHNGRLVAELAPAGTAR